VQAVLLRRGSARRRGYVLSGTECIILVEDSAQREGQLSWATRPPSRRSRGRSPSAAAFRKSQAGGTGGAGATVQRRDAAVFHGQQHLGRARLRPHAPGHDLALCEWPCSRCGCGVLAVTTRRVMGVVHPHGGTPSPFSVDVIAIVVSASGSTTALLPLAYEEEILMGRKTSARPSARRGAQPAPFFFSGDAGWGVTAAGRLHAECSPISGNPGVASSRASRSDRRVGMMICSLPAICVRGPEPRGSPRGTGSAGAPARGIRGPSDAWCPLRPSL